MSIVNVMSKRSDRWVWWCKEGVRGGRYGGQGWEVKGVVRRLGDRWVERIRITCILHSNTDRLQLK